MGRVRVLRKGEGEIGTGGVELRACYKVSRSRLTPSLTRIMNKTYTENAQHITACFVFPFILPTPGF